MIWNIRRLFFYLLLLGLLLTLSINLPYFIVRAKYPRTAHSSDSSCFKRKLASGDAAIGESRCSSDHRVLSSVWTHQSTGIMKYIQWIVTRKLGNVHITVLNDQCEIVQQDYLSGDVKTDAFIQIYILSLSMDIDDDGSPCAVDISRIIMAGSKKTNQIYFKRTSIEATLVYQQLDAVRTDDYLAVNRGKSFATKLEKATVVTKQLVNYFKDSGVKRLTIMNADDMMVTHLVDSEKMLTAFINALGLTTTSQRFKDVVQHDNHQFLRNATWWDRSETAEHILSTWLQMNQRPSNVSHDYYHLHGNYPFTRYVHDNRQCFSDGIFYQMQSETVRNRSSTDRPERCLFKKFDCAFSDLYSFDDREHLYRSSSRNHHYFHTEPIKCGFAIPSPLDSVRKRYERNNTCQTIVFTCITNCYDPLPVIDGPVPSDTCFVALVDTRTLITFRGDYAKATRYMNSHIRWDLIDLGQPESLFRVAAKITETVKTQGHRMFPLAKWIVWLDGKAYIIKLSEVLSVARTPIIGLRHSDFNRTSQSEVELTVLRVIHGGISDVEQFNRTAQEIRLQEAEYNRDGFYNRSTLLGLGLFDIAIFMYRNHHPCSFRYLCGWHNEINYFSYRGQLSVYYSAERLNLTRYLGIIARSSYHTLAHRATC